MTKLYKSVCFAIVLCTSASLQAQIKEDITSHRAFKKGVKFFNNKNYILAEEQFQILLDSGFTQNELLTYQAQVHLELHQPHAAREVIKLSKKRNEDLDFLSAVTHYFLEEFDEALQELDLVKDTATYHIDDMRRRILYSKEHYKNYQGYTVQNFGPEVNSKYQEYAPVMYDSFNELLFTSRNDTSEYTAHDGLAFEKIHDTSIDSLNRWHVADPFEFHWGHEKQHDATVQAYQHGRKLITYHDGKLYRSHLVDNAWEEDGPLDLHRVNDGIDTHCYIADDESYVIFASDFHSFGHDLDLFVCYKNNDGTWTDPKPLEELNTLYDEDAPFLADDSTLYFSSRGHGSLGGYDVFMTRYDHKARKWSKPKNLDYPINTVAEDIYFSTYGKVAFISSTREGGYGSLDLYRILLFNEFKIEGFVLDRETKEPIRNAEIEFEYDEFYFRTYADTLGHYEMFVPVNKNIDVKFHKDEKLLYEDTYYVDVFFREKNDRRYDFVIPTDGTITTRDIASGKKQPTLIHIEMLNHYGNDPFVKSIAHDDVQHWSDSLKNYYEQQRIAHWVPGPGKVTVYFDLNSTDLDVSVTNVLDELYKDILTEKNFNIEIGGHTDPRGSAAYNQKLSVWRAETVAKYLYGKGVNPKKVKVTGFGEAQLIDTSNSESSHAKNRRVEIRFY